MTRYELVERIGSGGMAEIFRGRATAVGGFEKPVAIKKILPHLSEDKRFIDLLIAEANILSRLRHKNIVQIFDVGTGEDGRYFLVMEYVPGTDLGELQYDLEKRNTRLPIEVALHIGAEMAEALEHAHRATDDKGQSLRLVHRDVSPSNILLSENGEVKLTDFGIAKTHKEATGHGGVRGKYAYISPEQARNQHVDGRSDVFSLGVILFEVCLGVRLFSKLGDYEALQAVRAAAVPRPSDADPTVDARLEKILSKSMAAQPEDRFQSAAELAGALRDLRFVVPSTVGDPSTEIARYVVETARDQAPSGWENVEDDRTTVVQRTDQDRMVLFDDSEFNGESTVSVTILSRLAVREKSIQAQSFAAAESTPSSENRRNSSGGQRQEVQHKVGLLSVSHPVNIVSSDDFVENVRTFSGERILRYTVVFFASLVLLLTIILILRSLE